MHKFWTPDKHEEKLLASTYKMILIYLLFIIHNNNQSTLYEINDVLNNIILHAFFYFWKFDFQISFENVKSQ
jgi:hypothetical protein